MPGHNFFFQAAKFFLLSLSFSLTLLAVMLQLALRSICVYCTYTRHIPVVTCSKKKIKINFKIQLITFLVCSFLRRWCWLVYITIYFWLYDTTIGAISCWRKSLLSGSMHFKEHRLLCIFFSYRRNRKFRIWRYSAKLWSHNASLSGSVSSRERSKQKQGKATDNNGVMKSFFLFFSRLEDRSRVV